MSNRNRLILVLALLLTISSMTACGTTTSDETTVQTDETQTQQIETEEEADSLTRRATVADGLPAIDFEGAQFATLSCNENIYDTSMYGEEIGSPLHDAVYLRDRTVEERFNIRHVR